LDNFRRVKISADCPAVTTGILDSEIADLITIYPNPVTNILYINQKKESQQCSIYNYLGIKVIEQTGNKIDVSSLSSGIYFLQIENNTMKFVKQ
jgi:hypothetical protein